MTKILFKPSNVIASPDWLKLFDNHRRHSPNHHIIRHILGDYRAWRDNDPVANRDAWINGRAMS